ncbi:MAG TPA: UPF0182 family protein, partial [Stellaceae bacterium]|nr:UPF0182 family protein [Stellaceae bacterium]
MILRTAAPTASYGARIRGRTHCGEAHALRTERAMRRKTIAAAIIAVVAVVVIALGSLSNLLVDWLWFSSVGYFAVFRTIVEAKTGVFLFVFAASSVCLWVSGAVALRYARRRSPWHSIAFPQDPRGGQTIPDLLANVMSRSAWSYLVVAAALVLAFLTALGEAGNWGVVL